MNNGSMSGQSGDFEDGSYRRQYAKPHSGKHPIPTIQSYREHRKELEGQEQKTKEAQEGPEDQSKPKRALKSVKAIFKGEDNPESHHDPYPSANRHYADAPAPPPHQEGGQVHEEEPVDGPSQQVDAQQFDEAKPDGDATSLSGKPAAEDEKQKDNNMPNGNEKSASEIAASTFDPKEKRKAMKKTRRNDGGREVTDPVTHLPLVIHDQTEKDLKSVPENEPEPGEYPSTATGFQGAAKTDAELQADKEKSQRGYNGIQKLFPPPEFDEMRKELATVYRQTVFAGLSIIGVIAAIPLVISALHGRLIPQISTLISVSCSLLVTVGTAMGMGKWIDKKVNVICEDEAWEASRRSEQATLDADTELPESAQWMNSFLASVWPLINPDLFSSLIDTIEDVMQASLPKVIKMVSIDDMGQGNQSLRVLGIRWLPSGAASRTVGASGELEAPDKQKDSDRTSPQNEQEDDGSDGQHKDGDKVSGKEKGKESKQDAQTEESIREGMEAEEGDFVNLELALAYRSRSSGKSIKDKAKNAHLYLKFYLVGGVAVPVWVELRGFVATMRLRLQLTPDPPFVSLCTLTFLGQPKASLSCVPLSKHGLNLMDVPMISSFVQSAIDAALAEYVAPKSLTLNLKDMLVGEDFKKDTISRGALWIFIKRARDFKQGDGSVGGKGGTSDSYVTVSWGKFGKTVASTRIIMESQEPDWHEYATILVTTEELNAEEKLRLQLWDSDRYTADDDLGRVEVDLKELIKSSESHNKMQDRVDRFTGQDPSEKMAGQLEWSVGYFTKVKITPKQLEQQTVNEEIRSKDQLHDHISELSANKLREAGKASDDNELHQQRVQDYAEMENSMIISAPPSQDHLSGILSVQIHNITGLEVQKLQKQDKNNKKGLEDHDDEDEEGENDDLPDSYCNIILNQKKIFRTRTKPKNSKPFFNAGTERFVRDWRNTEVIVSVRDAREREDDPLIGIIYLPLAKIFSSKSQVMDTYPLVGGIGYGRARISMVWRSIELQLPPRLRGWDYGTVEIRGKVRAKGNLNEHLMKSRLKIRTNLGKSKMYPAENSEWSVNKHNREGSESAFLAVRKRYASCMVVEFRESVLGPDKTHGFAVLWLQDIADDEDVNQKLKVWKGSKDAISKAKLCCDYKGMEEGEQPIGEIEISLKFWKGLSGYHKNYASHVKGGDMAEVMECLDTITDENLARDNNEQHGASEDSSFDGQSATRSDSDKQAKKKLQVHTNDDSSALSDSDSDSENDGSKEKRRSAPEEFFDNLKKAPKKILHNPVSGGLDTAAGVIAPGHNDSDDASRGIRNQLRDYKDHHKQLHRQHRGIMQWRAAREVDHMGSKLSSLKGNISRIFHHDEKDVGVETEV